MRKQWKGGRSHVANRIVADSGSYTAKVWNGRAGCTCKVWSAASALPFRSRARICRPDPCASSCATQQAGGLSLRGGRDTGMQHAPLRGCHRGRGQGLHRQRWGSGTVKGWETCWLRRATTARTRTKKRNRLRAVAEKHEAKGNHRKADNIRCHNLGRNKRNRRKRRHKRRGRATCCATPPTPWSTRRTPSPART